MPRQTSESVESLNARLTELAQKHSPNAVMLDEDSGHISVQVGPVGEGYSKVIYAPEDNPVKPTKRRPYTREQQEWNLRHNRHPETGRLIPKKKARNMLKLLLQQPPENG